MEERARQLLLLAAVAGAGAAFGAFTTAAVFNFISRSKRREGYVRNLLESNGGGSGAAGLGARPRDCADLLSDEVIAEQLTRNVQFFGIESQKKVTESFVVVIGLGGVGSHAASMLLRSGVGRLLLVDFDQVSLSSLNRHAVATRDDVGTPKASCLKKHFSMIYPECKIEARVQLYDPSAEDEILSGQPDFVLDCIDNIDTKVALLAACVRRGLRVLSAMGAGARADPTRIRVADLRESSNDPLSRTVRYRLKKDHGIEGGIPVVFSLEKPKAKLLPFQGSKEEETPSDYQIVPGFRVRIIPVLGTIPAIFGQVMASYVVTQLANLDFQTEPIVNLDLDHYRVLHHRLLEHEELIYGSAEQVLVDAQEVMYIVKELWRGRSARDQNMKDTGRKMWRSVNELMLVRWDKSKPAGMSNLILLKFTEVIVNSEMIEYYDISGCYILRPWAMEIWELMKEFFEAEIKKLKLKPYYFPLFITEDVLQKEKDHVEGFAPEVAWVTKSGKSELEAPIAVRPTSETAMYPYFSKWIRSHRDLPWKCNQWCNIIRWEFSSPTPFIRSREFLWQEGHTAFATKEEADEEVLHILELYRRIYEEFLAVPVFKGRKSEMEKFAGGLYTTSVEAFVPNTGRGIQGATSHCLGQNFAKMFDIRFEDEKGKRSFVWQNSWAYTTRSIGVMVMAHGDDKGIVLPPRVAPIQVIVIPVPFRDADTVAISGACESAVYTLNQAGMRADLDARDNYSPGWKYSHWEMKGIPLRIEIGPRDLTNKQARIVRRDNGAKADIPSTDLVEHVRTLLDEIQDSLFEAAKQKRDACVEVIHTWDEFTAALNEKKLILAPWCDEEEVEKDVKARTKGDLGAAKTSCTPFDQPDLPEGTVCFASGKPAKTWSFWGRSY